MSNWLFLIIERFIKKDTKMPAFTLAEVLITITIVGVVAAITLPNLIQSYQEKVIPVKLKKFQAVMTQAKLMAEQDFGPMENWPFVARGNSASGGNTVLKTYFAPYLKHSSIVSNKMYLPGGEYVIMSPAGCWDFSYTLNDKKNPKWGVDRFMFAMCSSESTYYANSCGQAVRGRVTTYWCKGCGGTPNINRPTDREILKSRCASTQNLFYCQSLLEMDNWVFKSDNPWIFKKTTK